MSKHVLSPRCRRPARAGCVCRLAVMELWFTFSKTPLTTQHSHRSTLFSTDMELFNAWMPYTTQLPIPAVLDMRSGGSLDLYMGVNNNHSWGAGLLETGAVYGYGTSPSSVTYPGPTILTRRDKAINVKWYNEIPAPHLLHGHVEPSLLMNVSLCYPECGVPAIVHVHGLEATAIDDGTPTLSFGQNKSKVDYFPNSQPPGTLIYHDHALGLTRLNIIAGLVGLYIIEDPDGIDKSLAVKCDIPLLIQDKLLAVDGSILYPESTCTHVSSSVWVPEAFGTANLVNGAVAPFVEVPQEQCRLRIINGANARQYSLNIPFKDVCLIIAKDSGYVKSPIAFDDPNHTDPAISPEGNLIISAYERIEVLCDFRKYTVGSVFNVTNMIANDDEDDNGAEEVLQVRVVASSSGASAITVPSTLNKIKDLRSLWQSTGGMTRNITLQELVDPNDDECPMELRIFEGSQYRNFSKNEFIGCEIGKVEKWNFRNPSADPHPFHWHLVRAQCGPTDTTHNTNELRDVFTIPSKENSDDITQVCYVACTPGDYLLENSTKSAVNFGFDASSPYLLHCHILEHEENMMMTWFNLYQSVTVPTTSGAKTASSGFFLIHICIGLLTFAYIH